MRSGQCSAGLRFHGRNIGAVEKPVGVDVFAEVRVSHRHTGLSFNLRNVRRIDKTVAVTVTDEKTTKTVTVSPLTEVTINGQKGSFADLKPGMGVNLVLSSPTQASRIVATSKH